MTGKSHILCLLISLLHKVVSFTSDLSGVGLTPFAALQESHASGTLLDEEKKALQGSFNHQLGRQELTRPATFLIPFDKNHFEFSEREWMVFNLPDSRNEQMIVSIATDSSKKIKIKTTIKESSNIVITYQIHLKSNNGTVKPKFSVYLISDGRKTLLKEETSQEVWTTSSVHIQTGAESQLELVGILKNAGNQIALRGFTVQDLSAEVQNRYGEMFSRDETEDFLSGGESHRDSFLGDDEPSDIRNGDYQKLMQGVSQHVGSNLAQNVTSLQQDASGQSQETADIYGGPHLDMSSNISLNENEITETTRLTSGGIYDTQLNETVIPDTTTPVTDTIVNEIEATSDFSEINSNNSTNSYENPVAQNTSSSSYGVFTFFIVLFSCSAIVFAVFWWKRKRKQLDDEIPVFSRTSSDHGNPTFTENATDVDSINTENRSNYQSFQ